MGRGQNQASEGEVAEDVQEEILSTQMPSFTSSITTYPLAAFTTRPR